MGVDYDKSRIFRTPKKIQYYGATTPDSSYSAAYYLAQLTGANVWAVIHGKMRYVYGTNVPFLTDGGAWSVTRGNVTTEMWRWPY